MKTCRSRLVAAEGDHRDCRCGNGSAACRAGKWYRLSRQVRPALDRSCRRSADAEQDRGPGRVGEADDAAGTPGGVARATLPRRGRSPVPAASGSHRAGPRPRARPRPEEATKLHGQPSWARTRSATPRAVARRGKRRADAGSRRSGSERGWTGRIGMRCLAAEPAAAGRACRRSPEQWLGAAAPSRCPVWSRQTCSCKAGAPAQVRRDIPRRGPGLSGEIVSIGSAHPRRAGARRSRRTCSRAVNARKAAPSHRRTSRRWPGLSDDMVSIGSAQPRRAGARSIATDAAAGGGHAFLASS